MRRRLLDKTVKKTAVGNPVIATDSVTRSNIKLEMNGTTTQDGIPTLENPIEVINTNSMKINICGKNLFDPTIEINTKPDGGTSTTSPNEYLGDGEIKITAFNTKQDSRGIQLGFLKGRAITISCMAKEDNLSFNTYNNGVYEKTIIVYKDTTNKMTITVPSDNYVLCLAKVNFQSDYVIASNFQIEDGLVATDYEPYKLSQTAVITLDRPISKFDTLTKKGNVWGIEYRTGEVKFDGSDDERWLIYSIRDGFYTDTNDMKMGLRLGGFCDKFINRTTDDLTGVVFGFNTKAIYFIYMNEIATTVEEWKQWLQLNPLNLLYETEESEFIPLSQEQQKLLNSLHTNNPTTVITNNIGTEITLIYKSKTR